MTDEISDDRYMTEEKALEILCSGKGYHAKWRESDSATGRSTNVRSVGTL